MEMLYYWSINTKIFLIQFRLIKNLSLSFACTWPEKTSCQKTHAMYLYIKNPRNSAKVSRNQFNVKIGTKMIFKSKFVVVFAVLALCLAALNQVHGNPLIDRYRRRCKNVEYGCENGHCWYKCNTRRMSSYSGIYTGCTSNSQCWIVNATAKG